MKKSLKRLTLRAEIVRNLDRAQAGAVVGAQGKTIIPKTEYTCEILKCIPNTNWSVCELCVVQ